MSKIPTEADRNLHLRSNGTARADGAGSRFSERSETEETWQSIDKMPTYQADPAINNEVRRSVREESPASRDRYFEIYDLSPVGYLAIDDIGLVQEANLTAASMFGVPRSALVNRPISENIRKEDHLTFYQLQRRLLETGKAQECEIQMIKPDGTLFWVHLWYKPTRNNGFWLVIHDISASKKIEEANRLFERAVEQCPVSILITDINGTIQFVNPKFIELTGYSAEEAVGNNPRILKSGTTPPEVFEKLWSTISSGATWEGDVLNKSKDGSLFWEHSKISALRNYAGEITHFIAVKEDITEKKRLLKQLTLAKEQAESASRAKSTFLATMSHEIRTPMNGVIGMTDLLLESDLGADQREYAEIVQKSGNSLLGVINDILDFSKIEAGKLDLELLDFDLRVTLEDTAELLAVRAADAGLELMIRVDPAVPSYLRGDPGRLRQIITNLVSNAIKFTQKGEVVISAALQSQKDNVATIHFGIMDTGIGIPESRLDAIFEPFTQVDGSTTRNYGGTGLGLAICKQLVELMGGEIGVISQVGKGSTFWFSARFEKQPPEVQRDAALRHIDISGVRVLVVDSNETNRMLMATLLNHWGCRNDSATAGDTALSLLSNAAAANDPYQIVLLEREMSGIDGMELGRRIKNDPQLASTRMVMVTTIGQRGDVATLEQIGFSGYLVKPLRQSQLRECLELVLGRRDGGAESQGIITRHSVAENAKHGLRILLAEDNLINQKVALHMLKLLGYRVDLAANGWEAVRALEMINYDLVLMDCMMPDMDGYEATGMIRDPSSKVQNHSVPIIAMTANAMQGDREKCIESGMDDYLPKPVKKDALKAMLDRWFTKSSAPILPLQEAPPQMESLPLFDAADMLERLDNDRDFVRGILNESLEELPKRFEELSRLLQGDNALAIRQEAHTLKGVAANISAEALRDICLRLESAAKEGEGGLQTARNLLPELERIVAKTVLEIGKF